MGTPIKPYSNSDKGKKEQVAGMFNNIAGKYDFLNHLFSLNIDKVWRRKVIAILKKHSPSRILDVATGTGDLAIAALNCGPQRVDGIDISEGMLELGKKKIVKKGHDKTIFLQLGDAENIPFDDNTFDAITVAFGVRNFENLDQGLAEMYRVLKPNGVCAILEFTMPQSFPFKQLYGFYFKYILPSFGKIISKDNAAYTYLPESVKAFPQRNEFLARMNKAKFEQTTFKNLSMGIAAIYIGIK
ncbi:MAG: bifunctional demethylmenaquinone methyltransferase/2-methoxy-6-polyprenyl-1,4-benzoquinol methylase UbiE [Salinivirgaceae bacterium]|jgi:demethylmenaquinone methyltransferase/2-methoxy-6-polyprenyl-1,4-benzoquinol methylase|nr:bifunctional demethylmenaquinone methyltransferase/2-methoxy-6-polyprenyl-1,4-benzoquinol methylase UbiE [Salinivirgaceae bacterium]